MKHYKLCPAFLLLIILSTACGPKTQATPTTNPSLVLTSVPQTAAALMSAMPSSTPAPSNTPAPTGTPTLLPTPTSFSVTITGTVPVILPTQPVEAPTIIASGTDRLVMVSDLDVTDGTQFDQGEKFTKKWRLMNTGTSTWTTAYSLVHTSGNDIKGPASVPMPVEVGPGKIIDIAVNLVAPSEDGKYTSYWKLKNANGELFGIGASGKDAFWVQIQVGGHGNPAPTDTPVGTPASATSTPKATIRNVSLDVDNGDVTASCPHTFNFTGHFRLNNSAKVTYQWEVSDSAYSVPGAIQNMLAAGNQSVPLTFVVTSSGSGWLRFHITSPVDISSHQVNFSLTCQP